MSDDRPTTPESGDDLPPTPMEGDPPPVAGDQPPLPPSTPPDNARPGDTWTVGSPPQPPLQEPSEPRLRKRMIAGLVAFVLVAGAATAGAFIFLSGSDEALLQQMPASADVVSVVYLDPDAEQKVNLFRMSSKFPGLGSREDLIAKFDDGLDSALQDLGLSHEDLSWVGSEIGVAVDLGSDTQGLAQPSIAVLVQTVDEDAAAATVAKMRDSAQDMTFTSAEHDGVEMWLSEGSPGNEPVAVAIVDGTVTIANGQDWLETVIDTAHGSAPAIRDDAAFTDTTDQLPDGKLGLAYVNAEELTSQLSSFTGVASLGGGLGDLGALQGFATSVSAEPDGMAMDMVVSYDASKMSEASSSQLSAPDHENPLLGMVPGDALGVLAQQHADVAIDSYIEELRKNVPDAVNQLEDKRIVGDGGLIESLNGDLALEVSYASGAPAGALLAGTDDPEAMAEGLRSLALLVSLGDAPAGGEGSPATGWKTEQHDGVEVTFATSGTLDMQIAYAVVGDVGVIGSSPDEINRIIDTAHGGQPITANERYTAALAAVPATDGLLYVDVRSVLDALPSALPSDVLSQVEPNIAPIEAVVMGTESDASRSHVRYFVRIP